MAPIFLCIYYIQYSESHIADHKASQVRIDPEHQRRYSISFATSMSNSFLFFFPLIFHPSSFFLLSCGYSVVGDSHVERATWDPENRLHLESIWVQKSVKKVWLFSLFYCQKSSSKNALLIKTPDREGIKLSNYVMKLVFFVKFTLFSDLLTRNRLQSWR